MDSGIVGRESEGPSIQHNHVIWGSNRRHADETSNCDFPSRHDWSISSPINVVYKDLSTSADSLSGLNSISHEPDINASPEAGEGSPDARKKKVAIEQELLKHGAWSVGSQGHANGLCKPCSYVHSSKGCKTGANCQFCHVPHINCSNQTGNRPSKDKRAKCKELFNILHGSHEETSDLLQEVASQSSYMQCIMANANKNVPEKRRGTSVKEAQDPDDKRIAAKMVRAQAVRNIMNNLPCTQAAGLAAASVAAPSGNAQKRQPNLVSL